MKRVLSFACLVVLLCTMFAVPQASAATKAQTFANKASSMIGKTGRDFGYTDEWCAMFVKWCADQVGLGGEVPAQYNTAAMARWFHQNGNHFALTRRNSSGTIACWTRGTWSTGFPAPNYNFTPAVGDIAFFETGTAADGIDHVGIVVSVSGNWVTVVEGNTGAVDNSKSCVSKHPYDWKMNNSEIWGFARPKSFGSMPAASSSSSSSASSSSRITSGPKVTVTPNSRSSSAVLKWNAVSGADTYEIELYDAAGWKRHQNGANGVYLQKKYGITGTTYTFSNLERGKTYYVQVAACNKAGQWKFGSAVSFSISTTTTIPNLISTKTVRGYLTVSSSQKVYPNKSLTGHDGSYIYTGDYCRIVKVSGNALLVEYPTSGGTTKQRWIATSAFFCQFNYTCWSKTATQNITVKSRPGAGVTVGTVYKGDLVYVIGESGSYYQILYPAGSVWKLGYLSKSSL